MATNRNRVIELYTPIYDEFLFDGYKEHKQVHEEAGFTAIEDNTLRYITDSLSGLGEWEDSEEFDDGGYADPVLGYPKTYTQEKRLKRFKVSFEAVDMDEQAILNKVGLAKSMGRGANAKVERETSAIFNTGFTTAGPDGQYFFDSDHPKNSEETGTTYDNLLSGAFSHDNLEAAETEISDNFISEDGIPIMPTEDPILLFPPNLRGAVARVLNERAQERPGVTTRDINRFVGKGKTFNYKPVEWWWLGAGQGRAGSDTAWYIVFKQLGFLKIIWNKKPHYNSWVDYGIEAYCFSGRMIYDCGFDNWRAGFGSTGV
jgi:hypothetical protein